MKKISLAFLALLSLPALAKDSFLETVSREKWGDLEVVWIEDDKFPKYTASIYFQDGSIHDSYSGLTQATFDQMTSGTEKENQRQIAEFFDFYGVNIKHSVTHEYSVLTVQGLTKDIVPVMGKVCELMNEAKYPENELKSYVDRAKSQLKNLVTSHSSLADRVFRNISLNGTPFAVPVEGTLAGFDKMNSKDLKGRLVALNKTKKVLYLAGPSDVKDMKKVLTKECHWSNESSLKPVTVSKPSAQSAIYLVPVTGSNQAQIRIGRYLNAQEVQGKHDYYYFLSGFLGGGFTSKLVQELRVKRGLTYSAGAYVGMQRDYGRAGVTTFSKNETAADSIALIRDIFQEVSVPSKISPNEFKHQQGHQIGGYAFGFEETSAFLARIMLYDHQGRKLEELAEYPERIRKMTISELASSNMEAFPWDRLTVVVIGARSLEKSLSKIRPVRILRYTDFL